jgi:acyl-CoA reductase-like NAD-dependent aldehyde dehydrogenase
VVGIVAEEKSSLLGVVLGLAPVLAAGNCAVLLASQKRPLSAITLAECLATSDVPAGVVNILTGLSDELTPHLASHMEIDGLDLSGVDSKSATALRISSVDNLKRVHSFSAEKSPERILSYMEYKTLWHPIGV